MVFLLGATYYPVCFLGPRCSSRAALLFPLIHGPLRPLCGHCMFLNELVELCRHVHAGRHGGGYAGDYTTCSLEAMLAAFSAVLGVVRHCLATRTIDVFLAADALLGRFVCLFGRLAAAFVSDATGIVVYSLAIRF